MQTTRQRILDFLEQRGSASARQLGQAFGITQANVRHHLGILQARGLVQPLGQRPAEGRGRPQTVYTLVQLASGGDLAALTSALLQSQALGEPGDETEARLDSIGRRMLGEGTRPAGRNPGQRLVAAVKRLAPLGYKPHWEARPQGPEVVLGRCPYAAIIAEHPELCRMDAHILEELLGAPVEQTAKLESGPQGLPQCVFVMKEHG